ncbi:AMP-dependent synthetase/ligase [Ophiocordyceps camponoti-floridani]|uniref:AMP-dependent synthetase/ligase n=1 Tax=Ophiocordyceps camponoti-floridani TaxID=2030778 RepID=A0A8H4Q8Y2_9HYPO|nr:AMP-dependent synthetase/ligase [Ophiocordyceps camponoti-floridani]
MPLPSQRTFILLPVAGSFNATATDPRPMTSRQVRKAHKQAAARTPPWERQREERAERERERREDPEVDNKPVDEGVSMDDKLEVDDDTSSIDDTLDKEIFIDELSGDTDDRPDPDNIINTANPPTPPQNQPPISPSPRPNPQEHQTTRPPPPRDLSHLLADAIFPTPSQQQRELEEPYPLKTAHKENIAPWEGASQETDYGGEWVDDVLFDMVV